MDRNWTRKEDIQHILPTKHKFPFFCCAGWIDKKQFEGMRTGSGFWFRIFWGYGLHFTNGMKLFSERNGFEKRLKLPFGWRVKFIKPKE